MFGIIRRNMEKKKKCLIFLSWQSDRKNCRNFIMKTIEKIPKKLSDFVTVTIDRDTAKVPGSPDIGDTIFEKIDNCDLFIADITLINDADSKYRRTPNPNVMIELGYAIKTLGWERILLLQCKDYGDIEELPFDINHRRICSYTLGETNEKSDVSNKKKEESTIQILSNISETIKLLLEKGILYGGRKGKVPKFEIVWKSNNGYMSNLMLEIKNVSSLLVSGLRTHSLSVRFEDNTQKDIGYNARFDSTSLKPFDSTNVQLFNNILGYGPGNTNEAWSNIDLIWQFSCEDEIGNIYWYEMRRHINDSKNDDNKGLWQVKYIG